MAITNCMISYSLYTTLIILISLIVAINGFRVDDVCRQTRNPQLCVVALGGPQSKNRNLPELAMTGFETARRGAILSESKFRKLVVSSPRPDLNSKYTNCEKIYEEVSGTITSAQQAGKFGRWDQVIPNVVPVPGDVDRCEDLFIGTSPVHSLGGTVRVAAEAILVIAKTLAK